MRITWYPVYEERTHAYLTKKLQESLKKPKVEFFDIIEDELSIMFLLDSRDVERIEWA